VRQGRTDAWIAHKLDISVEQLEQFKREHLSQPEPPPPEAVSVPAEEPEGPEADGAEELEEEEEEEEEEPDPSEPSAAAAQAPGRPRRRRRGRRGGRRRAGPRATYEGTFDHGTEGYGLWLDPAVSESQVYADHWAGHRAVTVTVEPDAITIRRTGGDGAGENGSEAEQ
jgi:hypothetical protein